MPSQQPTRRLSLVSSSSQQKGGRFSAKKAQQSVGLYQWAVIVALATCGLVLTGGTTSRPMPSEVRRNAEPVVELNPSARSFGEYIAPGLYLPIARYAKR